MPPCSTGRSTLPKRRRRDTEDVRKMFTCYSPNEWQLKAAFVWTTFLFPFSRRDFFSVQLGGVFQLGVRIKQPIITVRLQHTLNVIPSCGPHSKFNNTSNFLPLALSTPTMNGGMKSGVCLTFSECAARLGEASGNCASGFETYKNLRFACLSHDPLILAWESAASLLNGSLGQSTRTSH